jgi:multiple sugar transport system permease protein
MQQDGVFGPITGQGRRVQTSQSDHSLRANWWHERGAKIVVPYLFLAPFLILFLVFTILPLAYALNLSVFRDTLVGGRQFAGVENYVAVFGDAKFWEGVTNMLLFGIMQMPVMLGMALVLALILDSGVAWGRSFFRIAFYLPHVVPTVLAALVWGYLYGPAFGPFTQLAQWIGFSAPNFLSDTWMLPSLANIVTWEYTGYNMIILFAALQAVPRELEEAAVIDGASSLRYAIAVKIPLIKPALLLTVIFSIIGTLQLFSEPQLMKAIAPHVVGDNYTPNVYAYSLAFTNQEYNYSAAVSFVLGALVGVISYVFMWLTTRRGVHA